MLNTDIDVIYRKPETDTLYLKNKFYGTLLQISEPEYDIIRYYADHPDMAMVCAHFADDYELTPAVLTQLIDRAMSVNLILTDTYADQRKRDDNANQQRVGQLNYFLYYLNRLLGYIHLRFVPKFKGNMRYFQLFTIQSTGEYGGQALPTRWLWLALLAGTGVLLADSWTFASAGASQWGWDRLLNQSSGIQSGFLFLVLLIGVLLSTLLHEATHYLLYRYYGGQTSEVGVALLITIVPVIFVNTNSLYLWDSRKARMLVTGGGILMDLWQVITLGAIYLLAGSPTILVLAIWLFMFVSIRLLMNLNPFIPGTDGYFLCSDFWKTPDLYHESQIQSKVLWQQLKRGDLRQITRRSWLACLYILLSVVSITFYYGLLTFAVIAPLWVQFLS